MNLRLSPVARVRIVRDDTEQYPESIGLTGTVIAIAPALPHPIVVAIDEDLQSSRVDGRYHCRADELEVLP